LQRRSNRTAHALRARAVGPNDIVALVLPNGPELVTACLAIWKLGATPQPLSPSLTRAELERILGVTKPSALLAGHEHWIDDVRCVVPAMLLEESECEDDLADAVSAWWFICSSSGSTGQPKVIRSGHNSQTKPAMMRAWRLSAGDRALIAAPLTYGGPFICCFCALLCGATVVLAPRFQDEATLAMIDRHQLTWLLLVPTMMGRIARLPEETRRKYQVSSVRTVWHVGAPCPPHVKEAWVRWLGPEAIWEIYAATDGCACTVIDGSAWLSHRGSVGRVVDGEIRIADELGNTAAPGTVGEVFMRRKPGQAAAYQYLSEETRRRDAEGWEATGDMGWMDESGYLYLGDRRTDMILVGGANVFPAEIEAALEEHPGVQSSAASS
jgi:bile acid-coenzyme A ligase